jgi:two-component system LytT family sensor kinase
MKEPTFLVYVGLVACCLLLALAGLYLLANFSRLFRGTIKNELLRKNVAAWLIIFCLSSAMAPMNGGFFYIIAKYGWAWAWLGQLIGTTVLTLFVFNLARYVAEHKKLKQLSFTRHKLLVFGTLIIVTVMVNLPLSYIMYDYQVQYLRYSVMSSIYLGGATGLVYGVISYLDIERKRKFDEKELELSRLRELKSKAELDALHSKVNPHFLYNALNSIADLSITDGRKARKMTIALADLFRYSINYSQNNYSTVNDEMAMTEVYLQIEKIRFEDQLNYSVHMEGEMGHFLVPRFILQPLVENAVKHGLKVTGKMTEIFLHVRQENGSLLITIADNGPSFPSELMPGYGVKSVYDKLDLLFPGQYEIHFSNEPRKQVVIHIHKPMKDEPAL